METCRQPSAIFKSRKALTNFEICCKFHLGIRPLLTETHLWIIASELSSCSKPKPTIKRIWISHDKPPSTSFSHSLVLIVVRSRTMLAQNQGASQPFTSGFIRLPPQGRNCQKLLKMSGHVGAKHIMRLDDIGRHWKHTIIAILHHLPSPPSHRSWVRNSSSVVAPVTLRPPSRRPPPPMPPPRPRSPEAALPATPGAASAAPGCGGSRRLLGTPGPAPWQGAEGGSRRKCHGNGMTRINWCQWCMIGW